MNRTTPHFDRPPSRLLLRSSPGPLLLALVGSLLAGPGVRISVAAPRAPEAAVERTEDAKLIPTDGGNGDLFGESVATTDALVVVGAYSHGDGAAYVYSKPAGGWPNLPLEVAKLVPSDPDPADLDKFGFCVAVSGDVIVVGSPKDDDNGTDSGSAYVFVQPPGGWSGVLTESAKLVSSDGAPNDDFGLVVAIDGDTIVVSAYKDDDGQPESGSGYVFTKPAGGWAGTLNESAKLIHPGADNFEWLGLKIDISGDTIVAGAKGDIDTGSIAGAAHVFVEPPGGWSGTLGQSATLAPSDGEWFQVFGEGVAIDGDTIVVGSHGDNDNGPDSGSAYVFVEPPGGWAGIVVESAKLLASDGTISDTFGRQVDIFEGTIVVAAHWDDHAGNFSGSAYLFEEPAGGWSGTLNESLKLRASDAAAGDTFGKWVSVAGDTVVVGAPGDDPIASQSGAAYIFDLDPQLFADGFESGDTSAWSEVQE